MRHVDVGDARFEIVEHGQGEPVVLVHGSGSDRRTWHAPRIVLGESHRVLTYSRRYHWPNPPIPEGADYSMPEHVDDLRRVIDALGLGSVHLVGHSYGAFICLLLATTWPAVVRSLVLAEPPVLTLFASNSPKPGEVLSLLSTRPRAAVAILNFGLRGVGPATTAIKRGRPDEALRLFATAVLGRDSFQRLSAARLAQARDNFIEAELTGSGFPPLEEEEVRAVKSPVLLVTGERSPRLFHCFTDRLQELFPHAQRVEIPGASHIMHEDNTPAYTEAVQSFLGTSTPPGRDGGDPRAANGHPSSKEVEAAYGGDIRHRG